MDSRKTFKLFQDAQLALQKNAKQLDQARQSFEAKLRDARAAFKGQLGEKAAHVYVDSIQC